MHSTKQHIALIVMGVSGVGKTSVGRDLAQSLDAPYVEADEFHPPANILAMKNGNPLTDEMRMPWLKNLSNAVEEKRRHGNVVVACSALKRIYRDVIRQHIGDTGLIYLNGTKESVAARLAARQDHFMPLSLLDSQFRDLEEPSPDERAITIDVSGTRQEVIERVKNEVYKNFPSSLTTD